MSDASRADAPIPSEAAPGGGLGAVAHSMATALVSAGVPAVVGWDGSVDDRAATVFARELYGRLAVGDPLGLAVADARRVLIGASDEVVRRDWHLAASVGWSRGCWARGGRGRGRGRWCRLGMATRCSWMRRSRCRWRRMRCSWAGAVSCRTRFEHCEVMLRGGC